MYTSYGGLGEIDRLKAQGVHIYVYMWLSVCVYVRACMCVCVWPPFRLIIISGMIWTPCDWLNKFYSFYVAAIVGIVSTHGLSTDACHGKQPNKYKLELYKPPVHFNSSLKWLYISSKIEYFGYKGGCNVTCIEVFKRRTT